jgi:glucokinase
LFDHSNFLGKIEAIELDRCSAHRYNMQEVAGIDLGGTNIKIGRFDREGNCTKHFSIPTPQPSTPEAVLEAIWRGLGQIVSSFDKLQAIGICTPGPADASGRVARLAINLEGWKDIPVAGFLQDRTKLPVVVANDGNCAGLGEAWLGAGRGYRNMIMLTLGTGVGGAILLDGKLYTGSHGAGGELGLINLSADGPECNSGNRGSLEQHISALAVLRETGKEPAEWGALAAAGEPQALEFWRKYGHYLGLGLTSLVYVLTPELIILGGGIAASSQFFLPAAEKEITDRVLLPSRQDLKIVTAELGNRSGMLGAAKLAWQMLGQQN